MFLPCLYVGCAMMANERVKSSQKGKEKEDGAPQRLVWLPSLKEGTPKKASYLCVGKMVSGTQTG